MGLMQRRDVFRGGGQRGNDPGGHLLEEATCLGTLV